MSRDERALPVELTARTGAPVRERADAARNRQRVLAAADRLFAERGVSGVTMDEIAAEAGVGKGTLYRRFGDRGGLAVALLDERERELQAAMMSGPPPLGPGAPPAERLVAFVGAYLRHVERHLDLVLLSETSAPGARLRTGARGFWGAHCRHLLAEAGAPAARTRADVLLAALSGEQVAGWREEGRATEALADDLAGVARALLVPARDAGPARGTGPAQTAGAAQGDRRPRGEEAPSERP